jgi:hypothetical protein
VHPIATMNVAYFREMMNRYGIGSTLHHAAYRAANHVAPVAWWRALALTPDRVEPAFLSDPRRAKGRMLQAREMEPFVDNPANQLSRDFIREAAVKGDRCFAFFDDAGGLTSYGWYSVAPTRLVELDANLFLCFDASYAYMYHGYTLEPFRGQRLHAIGMAAALQEYAREGVKGLVSYVDSSNFASLRSCYRMGYLDIGHLLVLKVGHRYICRSSPACRPYDLRIEVRAAPAVV